MTQRIDIFCLPLPLLLSFCISILLCCTIFVSGESRVAYETEIFVSSSSSWHSLGPAPPTARISILFALRHSPEQLSALNQTATDISTPGTSSYRQYWTLEKLNQEFAPLVEAQEKVMVYLTQAINTTQQREAGATGEAQSKVNITIPAAGWIRVKGITVSDASELLHTNFQVYQKTKLSAPTEEMKSPPEVSPVDHHSDKPFIRAAAGYSLPESIATYVDFVGGVTKLPGSRFQAEMITTRTTHLSASQLAESGQVDASYVVTPKFLRNLYNIPTSARGGDVFSHRQAIPAFLEQYFSPSDLDTFLQQNSLPPGNVSRIIGFNDINKPGGEASLDVQLIIGLAPGVKTEFQSFAGRRDNTMEPSNFNQEPFLDWLVLIGSDPQPPLVHSVSYADDEKDCIPAYMRRINVEFQKAAIRGITIMFASGDDGIGSVDLRSGKPCTQANPTFPSSSPWITSIGGTQLTAPHSVEEYFNTSSRTEVTCSSSTGCVVTTGGGFSFEFDRPPYQQKQVDAYLQKSKEISQIRGFTPLVPPASWFRENGRGFPDISVLATNYEIFVGGRASRIGGTSASSPVVAAMASLWNEILRQNGKPQLGFMNPWLYSLADDSQQAKFAFRDITSGDNACSQTTRYCCKYGFHATTKWDAVTGVGAPNWSELAKRL